jgi:hypothetical protein
MSVNAAEGIQDRQVCRVPESQHQPARAPACQVVHSPALTSPSAPNKSARSWSVSRPRPCNPDILRRFPPALGPGFPRPQACPQGKAGKGGRGRGPQLVSTSQLRFEGGGRRRQVDSPPHGEGKPERRKPKRPPSRVPELAEREMRSFELGEPPARCRGRRGVKGHGRKPTVAEKRVPSGCKQRGGGRPLLCEPLPALLTHSVSLPPEPQLLRPLPLSRRATRLPYLDS